jgi:phospholipase/lecithinase/hemolysin
MINAGITQSCVLQAAIIGGLALAPTPPAARAQAAYDGVVVFGTSLSDAGNAFVLWGTASTPSDYQLDPLLVPTAPYAQGGHHFTNGRTWVEQLAGSLGHAGSVRPAFKSEGTVATNYAVAAARARDDGKNLNLTAQVDAFLEATSGVASSDSLYVIEMGGNVTAACITPGAEPFACITPDEYLFWDGIHPTAAVHRIIAQRAAAALGQ